MAETLSTLIAPLFDLIRFYGFVFVSKVPDDAQTWFEDAVSLLGIEYKRYRGIHGVRQYILRPPVPIGVILNDPGVQRMNRKKRHRATDGNPVDEGRSTRNKIRR